MSARHSKDNRPDRGRAVAALTWLGGGTADDPEGRSTTSLIGALVLLGGLVAWSAAAGATVAATGWPLAVALSAALVFAVLVLAGTRTTVATGRGLPTRVAVGVAIGLLVGELAAMALFGTSVTERLQREASSEASTLPAVVSATTDLDARRATRHDLDTAVETARQRRDTAQLVARCEYQPAPSCPEQDITGVAGDGQITQNAQDVLQRSQDELDSALAARDQRSAALDARITDAERAVRAAQQGAITGADRGFGARWVAMNRYAVTTPIAMALRVLVSASCILLYLLPLLLHTRQDRTVRERHDQSRLRAELEAETAIAVKRAEMRAAAEMLQAEHQLANMRLALEAETAINREYHRQRVADAQAAETPVPPIETATEPPALPAPAAPPAMTMPTSDNLPAVTNKNSSPIPALPDIAGAAVRFLRPLVPPVITQVVENSTQQIRSAQKVFEEFEEFTFSFRRTTRVTVQDNEQHSAAPAVTGRTGSGPTIIEAADVTMLDPRESSADPHQLEAGRRAIEG